MPEGPRKLEKARESPRKPEKARESPRKPEKALGPGPGARRPGV